MADIIEDWIGDEVQVRTRGGQSDYSDDGVLEAADAQWLRLAKNGELLCFPVGSVRLVKLLKRRSKPEPRDVLLRPVDGGEAE